MGMVTQETIRDMYFTEIGDIREQMAKMGQQIVRAQRSVKMDESDFQIANLQAQRTTTRQLSAIAENLDALQRERLSYPLYVLQMEAESLHMRNKMDNERAIDKSLRQIRYLSKLRQEKTNVCPCGKHKGIKFFDAESNPVNGELCPTHWWIKLSRLAFSEGRINTFINSTPYEKYIKAFTK